MLAVVETTEERQLVNGARPDGLVAIPDDSEFEDNESEFLPAFEHEQIGRALIASCPELAHLITAEVKYVWKRRGGQTQGKQKLAYCYKTSGMAAFFSRAQFVIWVAADVARIYGMTNWHLEALLFHELMHAEIDPETAKTAVRGHDVEMFYGEIARYGLWRSEFRDARDAFEQASLFDGIPLPFGSAS